MATTTQRAHEKELDTKKRSSSSRRFEEALREKIVGQDEAVQALVELYQVFCAGLRSPGRPVGNLLFRGQPVPARRVLSRLPRKFCSEARLMSTNG